MVDAKSLEIERRRAARARKEREEGPGKPQGDAQGGRSWWRFWRARRAAPVVGHDQPPPATESVGQR